MKRKIIHIDEQMCTGCADCIPNCPEGALQMIDGKARLVSDLFCDGLGACIGECPVGAISIEEREAEPYDERKVMENIVLQGENVIRAHLDHLDGHGETEYLREAVEYLRENGIEVQWEQTQATACHGGHACPGSEARTVTRDAANADVRVSQPSELTQWPIQLHLIPAGGPHFRDADVLLSADCVAYAAGDFHGTYLKGKKLTIACPKLDAEQQVYLDKLIALIDHARIKSLTVLTMEVPCCLGLLNLAQRAVKAADRKIPVVWQKISIEGELMEEAQIA